MDAITIINCHLNELMKKTVDTLIELDWEKKDTPAYDKIQRQLDIYRGQKAILEIVLEQILDSKKEEFI